MFNKYVLNIFSEWDCLEACCNEVSVSHHSAVYTSSNRVQVVPKEKDNREKGERAPGTEDTGGKSRGWGQKWEGLGPSDRCFRLINFSRGNNSQLCMSFPWEENITTMVVPSLSHVWLLGTPQTAACQAPLSSTLSQNLLKFMSTETLIPSNHLILCHPLLLLPSIAINAHNTD